MYFCRQNGRDGYVSGFPDFVGINKFQISSFMFQVSSFRFPRLCRDKQVRKCRAIVLLFGCLVAEMCGLAIEDGGLHAEVRTVRLRMLSDAQAYANGESYTIARPFLVLEGGVVDGTNPENTLEISFDEMSHDVHFYTYTVVHLNADGSESGLTSSEYLRGFTTMDITDYQHSINTQRDYTHYRFVFPNEDMQLTASGQYALCVYEDGDRDKQVAQLLFAVVEPRVGISANIHSKTIKELNGRYQQVDVDVQTAALNLRDPNEIKLVVKQNGRTDNQAVIAQPTFVETGRLRYMNNPNLVFEGGNEYHHFDAYSAYYAGTGIDRIGYDNRDYHALLFPDVVREGVYIHEYDVDGQYRVNAERTTDADTEAEYMWVHWRLEREQPWFDGMVYVGGEVFDNQLNARSRMLYDSEAKCYYLVALVKQGGYDYQYWFVQKGSQTGSTLPTDGSYWQTENEYTIYVYYRPFGARGDRLVGIQTLHSAQ